MLPTMPPPFIIKQFEAEDRLETVTKILMPKVLSPSTTIRAHIPVDRTKFLGETNPSSSPQPPYIMQRGATLRPSATVPENCAVGYNAEIAAVAMAVVWIFSFLCCITIKLSQNNFTGCNFWFLFPCSGHPADKENTGLGGQELGKVFLKFWFLKFKNLNGFILESFLSVNFLFSRDIRT